MRSNHCDLCSGIASVSIGALASTLGRKDRLQVWAESIRLCKDCLRAFVAEDVSEQRRALLRSLTTALTRITRPPL